MKETLTKEQNELVDNVLNGIYECYNDKMAIGVATSTILIAIASLHNKIDVMNANMDLIGEELGFNTSPSQKEEDKN